jgi:photosystem II stability/assembly factor-like uncharacterized protein
MEIVQVKRSVALFSVFVLIVVSAAPLVFSADEASQTAGQWVNISEKVTGPLIKSGTKITWPGDTAGVAVDPDNGDVYMVITNLGLWKSTDHGEHFSPIAQGQISGRCSFGYCMYPDPAGGGRMACFMIYGKGGMTLDGGKTWKTFASILKNWDFGAVDWSDPRASTLFVIRHEAGGESYLSHDAGSSWDSLGKHPEFKAIGIFGEHTLVAANGKGIARSTDSGKTWTTVSDEHPIGRVAIPFQGKTYWVAERGLIASADDGATWQAVGTPVKATLGPYFNRDSNHILLADATGFILTNDGGQTWQRIAELPTFKNLPPHSPASYLSVAWDPKDNILYASRMANPTYRLELKGR